MIVGAGRRSAGTVTVDALFDVTGIASAGGVKADPDLLGQAVDRHVPERNILRALDAFASGSGPGATHPAPSTCGSTRTGSRTILRT